MTVGELYKALYSAAEPLYGELEAAAAAFRILEDRFGEDRVSYAVDRDRETAAEGLGSVLEEIAAARPVQYITGRAYFCGMELHVEEGVLIPRPETEELVQWIAAEAPSGARVLDIGTGSGAIAIALSRSIEGAEVTGSDVSTDALRIARGNAVAVEAEVDFICNDILDESSRGAIAVKGPFDVIVSNPPYIPVSEAEAMHRNVRDFEPERALFVPDGDPLLFYRYIAPFAFAVLDARGALYFETHKDHAGQVGKLLCDTGFKDVEVRRDMFGRDRMVRGIKPGSDERG